MRVTLREMKIKARPSSVAVIDDRMAPFLLKPEWSLNTPLVKTDYTFGQPHHERRAWRS
jgi:hypothetical protein